MMIQKIPKIRNNDQFRKCSSFGKSSPNLDNIKGNLYIFPSITSKNSINSYHELKTVENFKEKDNNKNKNQNNKVYCYSPNETISNYNNRNKFFIKSYIQNNLLKSFDVYKSTTKKTKFDFKNFFLTLSQKNSLYKLNDSVNSIRRLDKLYLDCLKKTIQKYCLQNFYSTKSFFDDFKSDKKSKYVTIDDITKYFNDKIFIRLSRNEIRNLFHIVSNQIDFDNFNKIFRLENYNKYDNENNNENNNEDNTNNENNYIKIDENKNENNGKQNYNILFKDEYDLNDFCKLCKKISKSISDEICKQIFEVESDKNCCKININTLIRKYYFDFTLNKSQKIPQKSLIDSITVFNLSKYDPIENSNNDFLKTNKIINLKLVLKYLSEKIIAKQYEIVAKPKIMIKNEIKEKDKDKEQTEEKKEKNNKINYIRKIFSYEKKNALDENRSVKKNLNQECLKSYKAELPYFLPFEKNKNRKVFNIVSNNEFFFSKDEDKKHKNKNEDILKYL